MFDITQFYEYREDNRMEVKKAKGGLPVSLWDTYSSFASCYGGVIILGLAENKDGTFRRNWEGDYHCNRNEVLAMLRDQPEATSDMKVLERVSVKDLDLETLHGYRNRHMTFKPGHTWEKYDDIKYMEKLGAVAISESDGKVHPTAAGLLMFGEEYLIVREFPEYFLDYREMLDPSIREALANCLINTDYYGRCGSGVPDIYSVWENEGWKEPVIEEKYNPDRTILTLFLVKKEGAEKGAKKRAEKGAKIKKAQEIESRMENILQIIIQNPNITQSEIMDKLDLSRKQVQDSVKVLTDKEKIKRIGSNRKGYWKIVK